MKEKRIRKEKRVRKGKRASKKIMTVLISVMIVAMTLAVVVPNSSEVASAEDEFIQVEGEPEHNRDLIYSGRGEWFNLDGKNGDVFSNWKQIPHTLGGRQYISVDANGDVYVGFSGISTDTAMFFNDKRLVKFDSNGNYQWGLGHDHNVSEQTNIEVEYLRNIEVGNDYIYGTINEQYIVQFSKQTGYVNWVEEKHNTTNTISANTLITDSDDNVYYSYGDSGSLTNLTKMDSDGNHVWESDEGYYDLRVRSICGNGYIYALSATSFIVFNTDGTVEKSISTSLENYRQRDLVTDVDGNAFGVDGENNIVMLNSSFEEQWDYNFGVVDDGIQVLEISNDGYIYFFETSDASGKRNIYKIDYSGNVVWSNTIQERDSGEWVHGSGVVGVSHKFPNSWNTSIQITQLSSDTVRWETTSVETVKVRVNHGDWKTVGGTEYTFDEDIDYVDVKGISKEGFEVTDRANSNGERGEMFLQKEDENPINETRKRVPITWHFDDIRFRNSTGFNTRYWRLKESADILHKHNAYVQQNIIPVGTFGEPDNPDLDPSDPDDHPMTVKYPQDSIEAISELVEDEKSVLVMHGYDHGSILDQNFMHNSSLSEQEMYEFLLAGHETIENNLGKSPQLFTSWGGGGSDEINASIAIRKLVDEKDNFVGTGNTAPIQLEGVIGLDISCSLDNNMADHNLSAMKTQFENEFEKAKNRNDVLRIFGHPVGYYWGWDTHGINETLELFEEFVDWVYSEYGDELFNVHPVEGADRRTSRVETYGYNDDSFTLDLEAVRQDRTIIWSQEGRYGVWNSDGERVGTLEVNSPEDKIILEGGETYVIRSYSELEESMTDLINTILAIIPFVVIIGIIKMVFTVFGTISDDLK